jgi:hypothetical protein
MRQKTVGNYLLDGKTLLDMPAERQKDLVRHIGKSIILPETGGCGKFIYIATGLLFIFCGVYGLYKKFRFGRRVY